MSITVKKKPELQNRESKFSNHQTFERPTVALQLGALRL